MCGCGSSLVEANDAVVGEVGVLAWLNYNLLSWTKTDLHHYPPTFVMGATVQTG